MDIDKIQFGQLSQSKGIDKAFEDLDVNNDGKINSADEVSATSSDIKAAIQSLLNSQDEESTCAEFQEEGTYEKIYNELKKIETSKNYDINGDGKVTLADIQALRDKFKVAEYFGTPDAPNMSGSGYTNKNEALIEKFGTNGKLCTPNMVKWYAPDCEKAFAIAADMIINKISTEIQTQSMKDFNNKMNSTNSCNAGEGLGVSDILSAYDELLTLDGDLFTRAFAQFQNKLKTMAGLFSRTANSLSGTSEEISRLKSIWSELSTGKGTIAEKCKQNIPLYKNRNDDWCAKMLASDSLSSKFHGFGYLSDVLANVENDQDMVNNIASQLVNGDIPEGEKITFNLDSGERFYKSQDEYVTYKKNLFAREIWLKAENNSDFKYDNIDFSVSADGTVTATATYKGKTVYSGSSESYSSYKSKVNSRNMVTIENVGGKYVYTVEDTYEFADGHEKKGVMRITDAQMAAIFAALGDSSAWANTLLQGGTSLNHSVMQSIYNALGAVASDGSNKVGGDHTFTNELGGTSNIWNCGSSCGGATTTLLRKFVLVEKIRDLFEAAKKQAANS
ncbi:MAG: hypothetical protein K6A44_06520 [bacterium]|nr:hypothetical protein [bacterium]